VNAAPNYDSSVIANNKLVMRPGISRHAITFLSFFKARSLQHSNISSVEQRQWRTKRLYGKLVIVNFFQRRFRQN